MPSELNFANRFINCELVQVVNLTTQDRVVLYQQNLYIFPIIYCDAI